MKKLYQPFSIRLNLIYRLSSPVTILPQSEIIMFSLHLDSDPPTHSAISTASVSKGAMALSKPSSKQQAMPKPRMSRLTQ
jgi:hypothetical protein